MIIRKALINAHQTLARHPPLSPTEIARLCSQRTFPLGRDAECRYSLFGPRTAQVNIAGHLATVLSADMFSIQMHSNKSFKALAENVIM